MPQALKSHSHPQVGRISFFQILQLFNFYTGRPILITPGRGRQKRRKGFHKLKCCRAGNRESGNKYQPPLGLACLLPLRHSNSRFMNMCLIRNILCSFHSHDNSFVTVYSKCWSRIGNVFWSISQKISACTRCIIKEKEYLPGCCSIKSVLRENLTAVLRRTVI